MSEPIPWYNDLDFVESFFATYRDRCTYSTVRHPSNEHNKSNRVVLLRTYPFVTLSGPVTKAVCVYYDDGTPGVPLGYKHYSSLSQEDERALAMASRKAASAYWSRYLDRIEEAMATNLPEGWKYIPTGNGRFHYVHEKGVELHLGTHYDGNSFSHEPLYEFAHAEAVRKQVQKELLEALHENLWRAFFATPAELAAGTTPPCIQPEPPLDMHERLATQEEGAVLTFESAEDLFKVSKPINELGDTEPDAIQRRLDSLAALRLPPPVPLPVDVELGRWGRRGDDE